MWREEVWREELWRKEVWRDEVWREEFGVVMAVQTWGGSLD